MCLAAPGLKTNTSMNAQIGTSRPCWSWIYIMSVFLHLFHLLKCFDLALEGTVCEKLQYWFKKLERDGGEGLWLWFSWSFRLVWLVVRWSWSFSGKTKAPCQASSECPFFSSSVLLPSTTNTFRSDLSHHSYWTTNHLPKGWNNRDRLCIQSQVSLPLGPCKNSLPV